MITLYGIPQCDSVKKARAWLQERGIDHRFHDFKKHGVPEAALDRWLASLGWETVLNRKGTTWRGLDEATRAAVNSSTSARSVLLAHPSTVKRPVIEWAEGTVTVGFTPAAWPVPC